MANIYTGESMKLQVFDNDGRKTIDCNSVAICNDDGVPIAAAVAVSGIIFYCACDDPDFAVLLAQLGLKPAEKYIQCPRSLLVN